MAFAGVGLGPVPHGSARVPDGVVAGWAVPIGLLSAAVVLCARTSLSSVSGFPCFPLKPRSLFCRRFLARASAVSAEQAAACKRVPLYGFAHVYLSGCLTMRLFA